MKYKLAAVASVAMGVLFSACAPAAQPPAAQEDPASAQESPAQLATASPIPLPQLDAPAQGDMVALMHTNHGTVGIRLFPEFAPLAVENFATHAQDGFYDGLIFHRVIEEFMIQGGCPYGNGTGGESIWGGSFEDEFSPSLRHINGALAMANSGPNTNGSQFYIVTNTQVNPGLIPQLNDILDRQDDLIPGLDGEEVTLGERFPTAIVQSYIQNGGTPHLDFAHTVFGQVFSGMDIVMSISQTPTGPGDRPIDDVIIETIEITQYPS